MNLFRRTLLSLNPEINSNLPRPVRVHVAPVVLSRRPDRVYRQKKPVGKRFRLLDAGRGCYNDDPRNGRRSAFDSGRAAVYKT